MGQISGQVAVVTKNRYGYGMKIEGHENWFNSKQGIAAQKGDFVTFDSGSDSKSVYGLTTTGSAAPAATGGSTQAAAAGPAGWDKRQVSIVRQNAVTNANSMMANTGNKKYDFKELIQLAMQIERYTIGNPPKVPETPEQAAAKVAAAEATANAAAEAAAAAKVVVDPVAEAKQLEDAMAAMDDIPY